MIPKWLRNMAAGLFLMGSLGSIGVGTVDAIVPENCSIVASAPAANVRPVCRDNIDGDAQNYIFGGVSGVGSVAGINFLFPGLGGTGRGSGQNSSSGKTKGRKEDDAADEDQTDDK